MTEPNDLDADLWNDPNNTRGGAEKYADHLLEQHKACL
ncbi:MAG: hypothetical protein ACJAXW_003506 [Candidatus Azotimanducaceae bacterium]|jgi:hypothetical protein